MVYDEGFLLLFAPQGGMRQRVFDSQRQFGKGICGVEKSMSVKAVFRNPGLKVDGGPVGDGTERACDMRKVRNHDLCPDEGVEVTCPRVGDEARFIGKIGNNILDNFFFPVHRCWTKNDSMIGKRCEQCA